MTARKFAPEHPKPFSRHRRHVVAAAVVVGLATAASAAASSATAGSAGARATSKAPAACFWTPAADVMALGPGLVATVRTVGTELQVLHRVSCTDDTVRWLWMPPTFDGAAS